MEPADLPPVIETPTIEEPVAKISRLRWVIHLLALCLFPVIAGLSGILVTHTEHKTKAMLPTTISGLLASTVQEILMFAVIFALAWLASRVNARQLLLAWRGGVLPFVWGFVYAIALRMLIVVLTVMGIVLWLVAKALVAGRLVEPAAHAFRPQIENLIDIQALTDNPIYFVLMLTLISFVLAGLREELWRAGMLAGLNALFPRQMAKRSGQILAILIVAVIFGCAHTAQGLPGMMVTTILGAGLGAIMVWHRSIWEAVIAHGFFNATTFAFLYVMAKYFPDQMPQF